MVILFLFFLFFNLHLSYIYSHKKFTGIERLFNSITPLFFIIFLEFFILMFLKIFKPLPAFFLIFFISFISNFLLLSYKKFLKIFLKDIKIFKLILKIEKKVFIIFPIIWLVLIIRTSIVYPMGWDSLTYHLPKAALWAQRGSFFYMPAPGGWGFYQTYFGSGSILPSFLLMFSKSQTFLTYIDIFYFLLIALSLFQLTRKIKLNKNFIFIGTNFILSIPALFLSISSLYVDQIVILFSLLSFYYFFSFLKKRENYFFYCFFISLGIALSIKISTITGVFILLFFIFLKEFKKIKLFKFVFGFLLFISPIFPWILENIKNTGYPLGYFPLKIFNLELGKMSDAHKWYIQRNSLKYIGFQEEFLAFFKMFHYPFMPLPVLSYFCIIPLFISFFVLKKNFKENKNFYFGTILFFLSFFLFYFHSNFKVVRIFWSHTNARFLLPYILPLILISLKFEKKYYYYFLIFSTLSNYITVLFFGWSTLEFIIIPFIVFSAFLIIFLFKNKRILIIIYFFIIFSFSIFIKTKFKYYLLDNSITFRKTPNYWVQFLPILDKPEKKKIAITSGHQMNSDNWFIFYILGNKLQNEIIYIPSSKSGDIIDFSKDLSINKKADYFSWLDRLKREKVTHILSFSPASIELMWMKENNETFEFISGEKKNYGLFLLKSY